MEEGSARKSRPVYKKNSSREFVCSPLLLFVDVTNLTAQALSRIFLMESFFVGTQVYNALDETDECRNVRPAEDEIQNSLAMSSQVKLVDAYYP
ncbi:hypothetical protein XYCOK13_31820 [Xylanibacillus composti]|uniref:Uncharacterized protein n=1 Tax=Xylanibacillus composti TaxID=1572762 RepID=A0A8J4H7P7_9BACL|nr:hypothetical protein XYCOK13_31820 [Xylanibacillus composti]